MTAAKIMYIISRLPGCDGQAADAVSAYTQVKMEDAHPLLIQNRSVQTFGFVYHDTNGLNHGPVWKIQTFLLQGICTVILWQDYHGKGNLRKSFWSMAGRKFQIGNVSLYIVKRIILIYVDDIKLAGKTKSWSDVESTQPRIWSYDMEGHARKYVERYCELATKTTQQLYKVSTPCIDDHHFKEEEMKSVGELSQVCTQIVLKCYYLARIGRPDILWSVNKLARSITKWTKACDKRLESIDFIHSSHMSIQTILSGGKHCKTMQIGTVSGLWFCRRSWGLKIYVRWNIVHFWKSYICSNELDVQETNCRFEQFNRIWNYLFGHWIEIGWVACSGIMGFHCFWFWKRLSNFR